jgi:hypothetical protein
VLCGSPTHNFPKCCADLKLSCWTARSPQQLAVVVVHRLAREIRRLQAAGSAKGSIDEGGVVHAVRWMGGAWVRVCECESVCVCVSVCVWLHGLTRVNHLRDFSDTREKVGMPSSVAIDCDKLRQLH